jgi:CRP-like cAMP-binding protein
LKQPSNNTSSIQSTIANALKQSENSLSQMSTKELLPFIGNGAYLAIVSGFLMTDMLQLRLALVGGYSGLVLFHSLHAKPLKIPLRWSALFVLVNAGAAVLLVLDQFGATLTDEQEALFESHFAESLTRGQFCQLLQMAKQETIPDGTVLTTEGRESPNLYFIVQGQCKVYHRKTFAAYVDQGGFVNDVAFQRTQQQKVQQQLQRRHSVSVVNNDHHDDDREVHGAYGTVVTNGDTKVLVWDKEDLQQHLASRPDMDRNLKYLLSRHLMKSLLKQREARYENAKLLHVDNEGWYSKAVA